MELIINKFISLSEAESYIAVIDLRLRLMTRPFQAATGTERELWQSMINGELEQRKQLSDALRKLKSDASKGSFLKVES